MSKNVVVLLDGKVYKDVQVENLIDVIIVDNQSVDLLLDYLEIQPKSKGRDLLKKVLIYMSTEDEKPRYLSEVYRKIYEGNTITAERNMHNCMSHITKDKYPILNGMKTKDPQSPSVKELVSYLVDMIKRGEVGE